MEKKLNPKAALETIKDKLDANKDGNVDIEDIIILALNLPWVHVKRDEFLRKELKEVYPAETVERAIAESPAKAGIPAEKINQIVEDTIVFERRCVSGISAALGAPGGAAMIATIPADIIQYYGYTLRTVQKMLYLYGFPEIERNEEGILLSTHTLNEIILCLGIMNGVAGANNAIKGMAQALANGVEKKIMDTALTKGTLYPFIKQTAKWFGIKMTKELLTEITDKLIPIIGGLVGGTITFVSFKPCCDRLEKALQDTALSNMEHISSEEEDKVYQDIIDVKEFEEEPNI